MRPEGSAWPPRGSRRGRHRHRHERIEITASRGLFGFPAASHDAHTSSPSSPPLPPGRAAPDASGDSLFRPSFPIRLIPIAGEGPWRWVVLFTTGIHLFEEAGLEGIRVHD